MKKAICMCLSVFMFLSLLSGCAVVQKIMQTSVFAADSGMEIIRRKDDISDEMKKNTSVNIEMVKNEKESGIIVLRNDAADIENVVVSCSELVCGENTIPSSDIDGYRTVYVDYADEPDGFPQNMLPLTDYTNNYTVLKGHNQNYIFTVTTTADTVPGIYTGTITVKYYGGEKTVPMNVNVRNITLPDKFSTIFYLNMWSSSILEYYKDRTSAEKAEILKKFFDLSVENRCPANNCPYINESVSAVEFAAQLKDLFADGRVSTYRINYNPNNVESNRPLYDELVKQNLIDRVIYATPVDEPWVNDESQFPVIEMYKTLHENFPLARTFLTLSPNTGYTPLYGDSVYAWCAPLWSMSQNILDDTVETATYWPYIEARSRSDYWVYREVDAAGVENWEYGLCATYDENGYHTIDTETLWEHSFAFLAIPGCVGDGYINEDCPVPTIYMEMTRDGMEDFELVEMYFQKAQDFASELGITEYSFNDLKRSIYSMLHTDKDDKTSYTDELKVILPEIRSQLINGIDNLTVIHNESSDLNARTVEVFTARDATVKIEGVEASQTVEKDEYNKHVFNMRAGDADNYFSVEVSRAGVTSISSKLIRKSDVASQKTFLDIENNFEQIKEAILAQKRTSISEDNINIVTVNGKKAIAITFTSRNDGVVIPSDVFTFSDWRGASKIYFRSLNGSDESNFTQNYQLKINIEGGSDQFIFNPKTYHFNTNSFSYSLNLLASRLSYVSNIIITPADRFKSVQTLYLTDFTLIY